MLKKGLLKILNKFSPDNLSAMKRKIEERDHNHCHVLSYSPPIVYLWWGRDDSILHKMLVDLPLHVLYLPPWCTHPEDIEGIARQIKNTLKKFPNHKITFLCNEEFSVEPFNTLGVNAIFCNQNSFVNENFFYPVENATRQYDAVYNAAMASYKRHWLAADIPSLMLMTYRYSGTHTSEYETRVRTALAHAYWAKDSYGVTDKVSVEAMREFYGMAKVGLCLSEVEGSMFASMEMLLCGLPLVSTPCVGGRSTFWDSDYVTVAEPNEKAIAEAVADMISRKLDPQLVRQRTLEKVEKHRQRLRDYLSDDIDPLQITIPWPPGSHGISEWTDLRQLANKILQENR